MSEQWYYTQNKEKKGPVSEQQLKQFALSGELKPADLVWKKGMASWQTASQVKGLFAVRDELPPLPSVDDLPPLPGEEDDAKRPRVLRAIMQRPRRTAVSVVVLVVVAAALVAFRTQIVEWIRGRPDAKVVAELEQKITKWQSKRDKLKQLLEQLQTDKTTTVEKLSQLGIRTESDLAKNPKAQVLDAERVKTNQRIWLCETKIEDYDLAILKADTQKTDIVRRRGLTEGGVDNTEVHKLMETMASLDKALESQEEPPAPPEITLEQDLNPQAKLATTDGGGKKAAKELASPSNREMRRWTRTDGTTFEAEFVSFTPHEGVVLKQPDGKEITVRLPKLSDADQKYVKKTHRSQPKSETK